MSNKTYPYDYMVVIGRFEPLHYGHQAILQSALSLASKVIVCVGSAFQPRSSKNPWTYQERDRMIQMSIQDISPNDSNRIVTVPIRDDMYNDQRWVCSVQAAVDRVVNSAGWTDMPTNIGLIGHKKDRSSYYLDLFPQWEYVEQDMTEMLSATDVRELYFTKPIRFIESIVPASTYKFLEAFSKTPHYEVLRTEFKFIETYKKAWASAPYPPVFVTVDAVVIQSGHILLITRKAAPGAGLLALPGGFVNNDERIEDAVIRELREETRIKVPAPVLRGNIKKTQVFDHPNRSARGRTFTHASLIELPPGKLPSVKGGDDARTSQWVQLNHLTSELMFEDHWDIIQSMVGGIDSDL